MLLVQIFETNPVLVLISWDLFVYGNRGKKLTLHTALCFGDVLYISLCYRMVNQKL